MDFSLELLVGPHEVLLTDVQTSENLKPFFPVLADIAEDGFGEVFDHVLGLGLLPFLSVFVAFEVAVFWWLFGRTI